MEYFIPFFFMVGATGRFVYGRMMLTGERKSRKEDNK
jgi:hypothetical protein